MVIPPEKPIDFAGAKYYAIYKDNAKYYFEFEKVDYNDGDRYSTILNPNDTMKIYCICPLDLNYSKVKDIYIKLSNGRKIHFVSYDDLDRYRNSLGRKWENFLYKIQKLFKR